MRIIYTLMATVSLTFCSLTIANEASGPSDTGTDLMKEASKLDPKNADPLKVNVEPQALESKYAKDAEFSSDSADQAKRDLVVAEISDKFSQKSASHIINLQKCQALVNVEEVKKCRETAVSKKSK